MRNIIIILFFISTSSTWGQSNFLKICKGINSSKEITETSQIKWLRLIYKTSNCGKISKKLKQANSFNEIIPIRWFRKSNQYLPFTPRELITTSIPYDLFKKDWDYAENHFQNLELFKEFRNLTHILYEQHPMEGRNICGTIEQMPSINSISMASWELNESDINCILEKKLKVYFIGNFTPRPSSEKIKKQIFGINNYLGKIEDLQGYEKLTFLGLDDYSGEASLKVLVKNRNLTRLYLNIRNIQNPSDISSLTTLRYLSMNCYEDKIFPVRKTAEDRKCKSNYLTDIGFLSDLIWLKGLDLSWNNIDNIEPISNMRQLESLSLRMNKITKTTALSNLKKLKFLDLVGNKLSEVTGIKKLNDLTFLNISYNQISDIRPISELTNMIFLGLGNNPFKDFDLKPNSNLKVLNLDGNAPNKFNVSMGNIKSFFILPESSSDEKTLSEILLFENLHKVFMEINRYYPRSKIDGKVIERFKNLEVLSLSDNQLSEVPDLSKLTRLKYLDLSNNPLNHNNFHTFLPLSLEYLNLKGSFTGTIEDFPNLTKLNFFDLGQNDLDYKN